MYNREVHMACPLKLTVLFFFKFCIFGIVECATHTNVISHCIDKQPCIGTYADIYNALALGENSFKIRSALYPAKKPSSVRVFVNVYGPNGTQSARSNAVNYTWSTNCLFVALPTAVLQGMSFGSILVDPRTEHLDITLPSFCCKVSESRREKMIEDVIAELQDLAVSPAKPDPRLNTAECVINGHDQKILDTGRSILIYPMLFCSFIFVVLLGPFLAYVILEALKSYDEQTTSFCFRKEKPAVHAADLTVLFMLLIEIPIIIYSLAESCKTGLPMIFIMIFIAIFIVEGPVIVSILKWKKYNRGESAINQVMEGGSSDNQGTEGRNQDTIKRIKGVFRSSIYYIWVNLLLYHCSWLIIGIMITPTWGLTVFLIILVFIIVFFFAVYHFVKYANLHAFIFSGFSFIGFFCAIAVPLLAGQSFYGRETAADITKLVLLYVITGVVPMILKFYEFPTSLTSNQGEPLNSVPSTTSASGSITDMDEPSVPETVDNEFELHPITRNTRR